MGFTPTNSRLLVSELGWACSGHWDAGLRILVAAVTAAHKSDDQRHKTSLWDCDLH